LFFQFTWAADNIPGMQLVVILKINYQEGNYSTILKTPAEEMLIPINDLKSFKIKDEYLTTAKITLGNIDYIAVNKLIRAEYNLDINNLLLSIILPADAVQQQYFSAHKFAPINNNSIINNNAATGLFLNYNVLFNKSHHNKSISGIQELNYFSEKGTFTNSMVINNYALNSLFMRRNYNYIYHRHAHSNKPRDITRLETYWIFDNLSNMTRLSIGDNITTASYWSGSTRFLGIKYGTNFSIRPDIVTSPLIGFSGMAHLPTAVEIYQNALPIYKGNVNIGSFDISGLPVISGRGELTAKTIDITGKISTITIPYYSDPRLLKPGLSNYSFEAGLQRKGFIERRTKYKDLLLNYNYMYGVNNKLTSGIHLKALRRHKTLGITNNIKIGDYGVVSVSLASNIHRTDHAQKSMLAYNYQDQKFNFYASVNNHLRNYIDIYSNDYYLDGYENNNYYYRHSINPSYQLSSGYTHRELGSLSLNFLSFNHKYSHHKFDHNKSHYAPRKNILSISYSRNIFQNGFVSLVIGTDLNKKNKHNFAFLSLGISFDNKVITLSKSRHHHHNAQSININSNPKEFIGWGYNLNLMPAKTTDYNIQVNRFGEKFNNSFYAIRYGGTKMAQLGIEGSILATNKKLFFTRTIRDAFTLVKVGNIKNIPVYYNNMLSGHTNKHGEILIPNVISYVKSTIKIDELKLPFNSKIATPSINTAPKWHNGSLVDFSITQNKSVFMKLVDINDRYIDLGSIVNIKNLKDEMFIGDQGKLYVEDIKNLKLLEGKVCKNQDDCYKFNILVNQVFNNDYAIDLGTVQCKK